MSGCKKTHVSLQSCYSCLYRNPRMRRNLADNKENAGPNVKYGQMYDDKPISKLKSSSLEMCIKIKEEESDSTVGLKIWDSVHWENSNSVNLWDYSDSDASPASSWSTLPNRSLLCKALPLDVGRCTCIIVKESSPDGGTLYTLYTNEGKGRQDRKLAVAHHRRRRGRSKFIIAQDAKAVLAKSDDGLIGIVTSNIIGSRYRIWDQGHSLTEVTGFCEWFEKYERFSRENDRFNPTVSTWTGNYRSMKAWVPKHQSMQLKNTYLIQHVNVLPTEWELSNDTVHQLFSKVPSYNKFSKRYELDFKDRGRAGLNIRSSVKNFQLTLEKNTKQTILQLGRLGKSKYVMDYRYPLTGYQAFCICLASIDSKFCCAV